MALALAASHSDFLCAEMEWAGNVSSLEHPLSLGC